MTQAAVPVVSPRSALIDGIATAIMATSMPSRKIVPQRTKSSAQARVPMTTLHDSWTEQHQQEIAQARKAYDKRESEPA